MRCNEKIFRIMIGEDIMGLDLYIVHENTTVIQTMEQIDRNTKGIAFVCDDNRKLTGVITDGDIRRFILKKGNLEQKISEIANHSPLLATKGSDLDYAAFMREHKINALPVINEKGQLCSIEFPDQEKVYRNNRLDIPVVIMAGGKGTRLQPYTEILPKPLIPIGGTTIVEHIMDHFEAFGCTHFNMIVNYKKNLIKSYFMDCGRKRDLVFTEEPVFQGTGGGLKLLEGRYGGTFFLNNCDILIEDDYSDILDYHRSHSNIITIVCATKNITIPYGTVETSEGGQVISLREKPGFSFLTNTGFYVIEPDFLEAIPENTFVHITDIIQKCIDSGQSVGMYPVSSHAWMDMGQMPELEKMRERLYGEQD